MERPYIVCHMMTSVDGRIDCNMTVKLPGNEEYYAALDELNIPSRVTGRETAQLEMALPGVFKSRTKTPCGQEGFARNENADAYEIIMDSHGILLWDPEQYKEKPLLIATSENASKEYLDYLDQNGISWIAAGKDHIDLKRTAEILKQEFGVERMGVVGGAHINGGFLKDGLIDEVSLLIGPGIDGREGMPAVFDGLAKDAPLTFLELKDVKPYGDGAVWLRYNVKK